MTSSQIKNNAKNFLNRNWGKAILIFLVYSIIYWAICFVANLIPVIGPIILFAISPSLFYGLIVTFIKLKRNEEILSYVDFLSFGVESFFRVWAILGNIIIKMIIPVFFIIIFTMVIFFGKNFYSYDSFISLLPSSYIFFIGIIACIFLFIYVIKKGYLYVLSFYILYDNPAISAKEIVEKSEKLMIGNRLKFFYLGLSFIGWLVLSFLTFGIGLLWLFPYINITFICFYESLLNKSSDI